MMAWHSLPQAKKKIHNKKKEIPCYSCRKTGHSSQEEYVPEIERYIRTIK